MRTLTLISALALAGCTIIPPAASPPPTPEAHSLPIRGRLGETLSVDGPQVRLLAMLEDSRCPADVHCVWAGQVRLSVAIITGAGEERREIVSHSPIAVADGTLELVEVLPAARAGTPIAPAEYRFGFRFLGGL